MQLMKNEGRRCIDSVGRQKRQLRVSEHLGESGSAGRQAGNRKSQVLRWASAFIPREVQDKYQFSVNRIPGATAV